MNFPHAELEEPATQPWEPDAAEWTQLMYVEGERSIAQALQLLESSLVQGPELGISALDAIVQRLHLHDSVMELLLDVGVTEAFSAATARRSVCLDAVAYQSIAAHADRLDAAVAIRLMCVSRRYSRALRQAYPAVFAAVHNTVLARH